PPEAPSPQPATVESLPPRRAPTRMTARQRDASVKWGLGVSFLTQRVMNHTLHVGGGADVVVMKMDGRHLFPLEACVALRGRLEPNVDLPAIRTQLYLTSLSHWPLRGGSPKAVLVCPAV